jgi:hypothetical protein
MAYTGNDPYEEAKLKAKLNQAGVKNTATPVGPVVPYGKYDVEQEPNKFYAPKNIIDMGDDLVDDEFEFDIQFPNAPADLTDIPTSTTNVSRPRTVAAGYDASRKVLTVVFRDGTLWNYDNVTEGEWLNFQASISKGRPWINEKVFGIGYPADLSAVDARVTAAIYTAAREAQLKFQSKRAYRAPNQQKNEPSQNVKRLGKTATLKAQRALRARTPKRGGANPSNGGKNPNK